MSRSILLLGLVLALGGCSGRSLGNGGGGGGSNGGGGGHGNGGGGGSAGGGGTSGSCAGLSEIDCNLDSACRADYCGSESTCGGSTFVGCSSASAGPVACPAHGPDKVPVQPCNCAGLDEASCVAAEASLGCTPSYCSGTCGGPATFITCSGPNQGEPACPNKCIQPGCRSNADCGTESACFAPGSGPTSCTACAVSGCSGDGDCSSGAVCSYSSCCGSYQCTSRCSSDGACGPGLVCDGGGHCGKSACSAAGSCPDGLLCTGGVCSLRSCAHDSDCQDGNYCVDGYCYTSLGQCIGLV